MIALGTQTRAPLSPAEQVIAARRLHPVAARVLQRAVAIVEQAGIGAAVDPRLTDWACWIVTANMPLASAVRRMVTSDGATFIVRVDDIRSVDDLRGNG